MVNTTKYVSALLTAGLVLFAGCGKSQKTPPQSQIQGVAVDLPKLQEAYAGSTAPDIQ
jgi:hypothetical protein